MANLIAKVFQGSFNPPGTPCLILSGEHDDELFQLRSEPLLAAFTIA